MLAAIAQLPSIVFYLWLAVFVSGALMCFYRFYQHLLKARMVEDHPTAKIRSAAQGYVELKGTQHYLNDIPLIAPLTKRPCTWYRYTIERYVKQRWIGIARGCSSQQGFEIWDETGKCLIYPDGAQVNTTLRDSWQGFSKFPQKKPASWLGRFFGLFGPFRYTEWRMEAGMPLLVTGNFHTLSLSAFETQHVISKKGLPPRCPFLLTTLEENKLIKAERKRALFAFLGYLLLLGVVACLLAIRFS